MATSKEDAMRDFILNNSEKLFTKYGYKNTSMDMLAETCGISKPTLYNYFKSKYDLFMDLYIRFQNNLYENGKALMAQNKDKVQIIEEIIDLAISQVKEKRDYLKMVVREHHMVVHENFDDYIKNQLKSRNAIIVTFGEFLKDIVRPEIVEEFGAEMLGTVLNNILEDVFWDLILGDFTENEKQKKLLMQLLKNGILA